MSPSPSSDSLFISMKKGNDVFYFFYQVWLINSSRYIKHSSDLPKNAMKLMSFIKLQGNYTTPKHRHKCSICLSVKDTMLDFRNVLNSVIIGSNKPLFGKRKLLWNQNPRLTSKRCVYKRQFLQAELHSNQYIYLVPRNKKKIRNDKTCASFVRYNKVSPFSIITTICIHSPF